MTSSLSLNRVFLVLISSLHSIRYRQTTQHNTKDSFLSDMCKWSISNQGMSLSHLKIIDMYGYAAAQSNGKLLANNELLDIIFVALSLWMFVHISTLGHITQINNGYAYENSIANVNEQVPGFFRHDSHDLELGCRNLNNGMQSLVFPITFLKVKVLLIFMLTLAATVLELS